MPFNMGTVALCLLAFLAPTALSIHNLGDVFRVDDRAVNNHLSSCTPYYDPGASANSGSTKILNKVWDQLNEFNAHTVQAVSSAQYNDPANWVARRILRSYFAIQPNPHPNGATAYEYPDDEFGEPMITYRKKLRAVRDNYKMFRNLINNDAPDTDAFKPKLFCDSTFMQLQGANSNALDKDGKTISIKDGSGKVTGHEKLPAYAQKKWADGTGGNVFRNRWFFWYEFNGDRGYLVLDRKSYPEIGNTDTEAHKIMATTLIPVEKPEPDSDDDGDNDGPEEATWHMGEHVILCPRSFRRGAEALAAHPPAPYTALDALEIVTLTFWHEIFHITDLDNGDQDKRGPKLDDDGSPVAEWWKSKSKFDIDRKAVTIGAFECLNLADWEQADPKTTSYEALSTKNCESFAWASLAINVMRKYQMDCSGRECEPAMPGTADPDAAKRWLSGTLAGVTYGDSGSRKENSTAVESSLALFGGPPTPVTSVRPRVEVG